MSDAESVDRLIDDEDVDTWLDLGQPGLVEIRTEGRGTGLSYPFDLAEFWEVVADTQEEQVRQWEAAEGDAG